MTIFDIVIAHCVSKVSCISCLNHGDIVCESCNAGYHLEGNQCVEDVPECEAELLLLYAGFPNPCECSAVPGQTGEVIVVDYHSAVYRFQANEDDDVQFYATRPEDSHHRPQYFID